MTYEEFVDAAIRNGWVKQSGAMERDGVRLEVGTTAGQITTCLVFSGRDVSQIEPEEILEVLE